MPHFTHYPWCDAYIWDSFQEWHLSPEYEETKAGRWAMDCPHPGCRITGAGEWATDVSQGYSDLVSFLTNPDEQERAKYFRSGYWPEINV
jgi:hypothetical protein